MSGRSLALSEDFSTLGALLVLALGLVSVSLLAFELRRRERFGTAIFVSGILAVGLLCLAVLRPVRVTSRGSVVGPRVVVLVDGSRRLLIPEGERTRRELAAEAARRVSERLSGTRLELWSFGQGPLRPFDPGTEPDARTLSTGSDLAGALAELSETPGEQPQSIVVISDGRLTRPTAGDDVASLSRALPMDRTPLHTIPITRKTPRDASLRAVRTSGAAVAHQPLSLTIEVGCAGGLQCEELPVVVHELRVDTPKAELARGVAVVKEGSATVSLEITLDRAGDRVLEISVLTPDEDTIAENDRRILPFSVTRDRLRLLHVAGRPTYDVRALRRWLKNDESVDLVAFFILRTNRNDTGTSTDSELALIPFPVDELFTEHLPSFDAVILQDIDARTYQLDRHLPALSDYVRAGGGLIMVGGPSSFSGGAYQELEQVLPVELNASGEPFEAAQVVPRYTGAGRVARVTERLRELYGDELPSMAGSNTLGRVQKGAIALWEHPERSAGGASMPLLALGESGDGRSIALGVDATHLLAFSEFAARAAGRGYGALWDGLLGWLMRDPRYEPARVELVGECIAGLPARLRMTSAVESDSEIELQIVELAEGSPVVLEKKLRAAAEAPTEIELGVLEAGGYSARTRIAGGPPTRSDFACERGGESWSDSRPDPERLARLARASGGRTLDPAEIDELPSPEATEVTAERHVTPLFAPWLWSVMAAVTLGGHWWIRRRGGLL